MTLWTKLGTLTKDTTTGSHSQTFTNVWTEAPKILFIWASKNTSNATFIDGVNYSFGWSDGTTSACVAQGSQDNIATSSTRATLRNDAIVDFVDETGVGTTQGRATVSSITSTDLVLQWATGTTATQYLMKYFAVGGSDITNAKAINTTIGTTGTGNASYTGFGFDPTFCMVMSILDTTTAFNAVTGGSSVSIGAGLSSTNRWVIAPKIRNGTATNDSNVMTRTDSIAWTCGAGAADTVTSQANLNAFVTDGIQLNITDAWAASTCPIAILGVKGGFWDIGASTQRSGSGTQNIATTANRDPEGVMLFNTNTTTLNTITNNVNLAIGANDGTNEGHVVVADVSGSDPMITAQRQDAAKVISHFTANATASSSTIVSEADVSDMATLGQFTLNWTTADSTARYLTYVAVSKLIASQTSIHKYNLLNNVLQSSIHKYHVLQDILQTSIHKYNVIGNAIADSIHKYNVLAFAAQQSIHKYNLLQNIFQSSIHKYNLRMYVQAGIAEMVVHIPLFIYPFHWIEGNDWQQLADFMAQYPDVQFIITVNPDSGPGTSQNSDFVAGFDILKGQGNASHVKILGYVFTDYGARAIQDIKDDIDAYNDFYPNYINGIMLDEMDSVTGNESYYSEITDHIHQYFQISWGNPGTAIAESYVTANAVDIFMISETADYPTSQAITDSTFNGAYSPRKFAMTVHSAGTYNSALIADFATKVRAIFVTPEVAPNPYDTLSTYLDELADQSVALLGSIHKYNIFQDIISNTIHKFHVMGNAIADSIHKYDMAGVAAAISIHKYDMAGVIAAQSIHKYHVLVDVAAQSIHKYHLFQIAALESIHKYNVIQNIVAQSIHKYNVVADVVANTIHKYNVLANVAAQSIHKYNIVFDVIAQSIHKYDMLQAAALASIHKYHIRADVIASSIHRYVIGKKVKKLISALGSGKAIELSHGAKILQDFIKARWPTS